MRVDLNIRGGGAMCEESLGRVLGWHRSWYWGSQRRGLGSLGNLQRMGLCVCVGGALGSPVEVV